MTIPHEDASLALPQQSPLFHAAQSARYERQSLIRQYEAVYDCRLVVLIDAIFPIASRCLRTSFMTRMPIPIYT